MGDTHAFARLSDIPVGDRFELPLHREDGSMAVEQAILRRRSVRAFSREQPDLYAVSQLLWSAAGITSEDGRRAAPSAGACYPLELYLVCEYGLFHYLPGDPHTAVKLQTEDLRKGLAAACLGQGFVAEAPITLVFAAVYERTTGRYGERGLRYVHVDVGHAAQNVHLQAVALGLASVPVGAFDDDQVAAALHLPKDHRPLYLVPVGHPASRSA